MSAHEVVLILITSIAVITVAGVLILAIRSTADD